MCRPLAFAAAFLCLAARCDAQSSDPSAQTQTASSAPRATPASANSASTAEAPRKKKPKKVWTEDNIATIGGTISVVGNAELSNVKSVSPNANGYKNAYLPAGYRQQVLQLRAQIDQIDKEIADFRNYRPNTSPSASGMDPHLRYSATSPEERVKELEDKKKVLQEKIGAIEDAARKDGIEPGQLR